MRSESKFTYMITKQIGSCIKQPCGWLVTGFSFVFCII